MILDSVLQAIRTHWRDVVQPELLAIDSALVVRWDNQAIEPANSSWIHAALRPGASTQASAGSVNQQHRQQGLLMLNVFVPFGDGDRQASRLADALGSTLTARRVGAVQFRNPSVFVVGRAGKWWQLNVSFPWYVDYSIPA